MPGPVRGRRQLMEATQANLEPIFLLYEGGGPPMAGAGAARPAWHAAGRPGRGRRDARAEHRHRRRHPAHPVAGHRPGGAGPDRGRPGAAAGPDRGRKPPLRRVPADAGRAAGGGRRRRARGTTGSRCWWTATRSRRRSGRSTGCMPGLAPAEAVERAKAGFSVRVMPGGPAALPAALDALAKAGQDRAGFPGRRAGPGAPAHRPGSGAARGGHARRPVPAWRRLSTAVLQELLLGGLWGIQDDEQGVQVVHHDAGRAVAQADAGRRHGGHRQPAAGRGRVRGRGGGRAAAPQVHLVRAQAEDRPGAAALRAAR